MTDFFCFLRQSGSKDVSFSIREPGCHQIGGRASADIRRQNSPVRGSTRLAKARQGRANCAALLVREISILQQTPRYPASALILLEPHNGTTPQMLATQQSVDIDEALVRELVGLQFWILPYIKAGSLRNGSTEWP